MSAYRARRAAESTVGKEGKVGNRKCYELDLILICYEFELFFLVWKEKSFENLRVQRDRESWKEYFFRFLFPHCLVSK